MDHLDCICELSDDQPFIPGTHLIGPGCPRARRARFATLYRHLAEAAIEIEAARRPHRRRRRRLVTITTLD